MWSRKTKMIQPRPPSPWMSLEIILAKRRRRYMERVWRRTRSTLDRSRYTKQLHLCNRMMSKSKSDYYTSLLSNNSANPRHMWNSVNKILHREKSKPLPDYTFWIHCAVPFLSSSQKRSPSPALISSKMITVATFLNHRMLKIQWTSSRIQLPVKFEVSF